MSIFKTISHYIAVFWITTIFAVSASGACAGVQEGTWITNVQPFYNNIGGGTSVQSDDQDYYEIVVGSPGVLSFTVQDLVTANGGVNLTATLYADGTCGSQIWQASTVDGSPIISTGDITVAAGTYTLQIVGAKSNADTYYEIKNGVFVASLTPPVMGSIPDQFFEIGTPFSLDLSVYTTATDGDPIISYALAGTQPSWLDFNTTTGVLSGTPDANSTFTLTATATDKDGTSNGEDFTLDSSIVPSGPTMADIPNQDIVNGVAYTLDISAYVTTTTSPVVSYTMTGTLPTGLIFNTATGLLNGTPTVDGTSSLEVYATVADGNVTNTDYFSITVSQPGVYSDLLMIKTPSTRYADTNATVNYVITIANPTSSALTDLNITDIITPYDYDLTNATTGPIITPSFDLNITITNSNSFTCTTTDSAISCTGGSIAKRTGNSGVPGLERIYYSITTPTISSTPAGHIPALLYNKATLVGTTTDANASIIVSSGGAGANPVTAPPKHADVIEGGFWNGTTDYNSGLTQVIQTKVSGEPNVLLTAVHLDGDSNAVPFAPFDTDMQFLVIPYITDSICSDSVQEPLLDAENNPLVFVITDGLTTVDLEVVMPSYADRIRRISVTYLDLDALAVETGEKCSLTSSTTGNLVGLGQCVNSANKYYDSFGLSAFERCNVNNGSPCEPTNHGYSCGPGDTSCDGYNPIYDSEYGCLMCTLNAFPDCSSDNFALRPDEFEITGGTTASYPDLLRAGEEYNITINAYDYNTTTNTLKYDQTGTGISDDNVTKYYADGTPEVTGHLMNGDSNLSDTFAFANGVTTTPALISYTDVGDITIHLEDRDWAYVDIVNSNDPTPRDCSAHGTYVCGDINATFIPDHFRVIVDLNNSGNGFTYLSNEQNMTVPVVIKVYAENKDDATVLNFTMPDGVGYVYYDNPMKIEFTIPDHPVLGSVDTNDTVTPTLFDFDHGFKEFTWNDTNTTQAQWFNYPRTTNQPVNPFIMLGSDVVVDVNSTYPAVGIALAPEATAYIDGTDTDDLNITYVYGRTHMARTRAMCDATGSCPGNMTFFFEFYGDKDANTTLITNLLGSPPPRSIDSVNWYRNTQHNTSSDGNVTGSTTNIPGTTTYTSIVGASTSSGTYNYTGSKGYPYKGTVVVPSAITGGTQSWLIYDKYKPDPAIEVRGELEYYGPGKWSGSGGADTSVDDETGASMKKNTNRRIRW